MNTPAWSGIYPSLATPFLPDGDLDLEGQRALVRFALDSGAHGLICFGLAGEVFRLTPSERIELLRVIVDECGGQVPVLAGAFVFAADLLRALSSEGLSLETEFIWLRP